MKTSSRRQDDGGGGSLPENMSPFDRINTEFGIWEPSTPPSTTSPITMMVNDAILDNNDKNPRPGDSPQFPPAPTPASANENATTRSSSSSCTTFNKGGSFRHRTPRYSRIDTFIENLDAACEALPVPLVGSASVGPPPASRATPTKELLRSSTTHQSAFTKQQQDPHPHQRPLSSMGGMGGIVKEVKFADEVVEIGEFEGMVSERTFESMSTPLERNFFEVRSKEPAGGKEMKMPTRMAANGTGAPLPPPRISRALRFDYRKKSSDFVKAATVVQSTYRGYKVRRGQPLKYLHVISSVKERLEELRQQFDTWKIAAWFPTDLTERVTMTESVMDLLLQLDSLQGVPVVVREFRKNVARDVIKFQEEVDGFLCRNSKHGVLFDLTRPGAKAAHGSNYMRQTKKIRNIVVQEPNFNGNLPESDSKACCSGHSGSWKEDKVGTMTSIDVTSELESDCQSNIKEVPLYSVEPHGSTERNFVLWSPRDAEFENERVEEKSSEENHLENVTELKKCIAPTDTSNISVPPEKKKKSLRVRFGIVSFGNKSSRTQHLSTDDGCFNAPPEDISPCKPTHVELLTKDVHHPPNVLSWEHTGNFQKKDDLQWTVSINKQKSLDPCANGRIQSRNDDRICDVHENFVEDCENRYPRTHARPQTPAQSDHSLTERWNHDLPAEPRQPRLDKSIEIRKSRSGQDREIRQLQTLAQPDYPLRETWEAEFPADFRSEIRIETSKICTGMDIGQAREFRHAQTIAWPDYSLREIWEAKFPTNLPYDKRIEISRGSTAMEDNAVVKFEPTFTKDEDFHIPPEDAINKDLQGNQFRPSLTNLQPFSSRVEYVSAKDVREGTIEPLLASDGEDSEMDYPVAASHFDCSNDTFRTVGGYGYTDTSAMSLEGNRIGKLQDMPNGVDAKKGDSCSVVVFTETGEKLEKLQTPAIEAVEVRQHLLLKNSENSPMVIPPTSILNANIREQLDGQRGNEYDLCSFDDLETISSCSNCAAYPANSDGEPWDIDSVSNQQVQHQPYALKGLVSELDEVFRERKGGGKRSFAMGQWKDEAWRDYTTTEFQPYQIAVITTEPNIERKVEVGRDDGSCKSFKTVESDNVQFCRGTEEKLVVGTKLVSPHPDIKELACEESKGSNLSCTSQTFGENGVASGSTALIPHQHESNMLSKLVEDNKRLRDLLKEVMKWNTFQANAMITLNERLELVESKK
ncbi:unnamed protein product [Calypogeia fissa]